MPSKNNLPDPFRIIEVFDVIPDPLASTDHIPPRVRHWQRVKQAKDELVLKNPRAKDIFIDQVISGAQDDARRQIMRERIHKEDEWLNIFEECVDVRIRRLRRDFGGEATGS